MSTPSGKDVIYIDIDDEITTIIDKVRGSGERIVALVLPKRATAFQSIVNMKLLKRSADSAKKHLVLITNEASLLPLAGNVGLYVAKTLQSKPEIPASPTGAHPAQQDDDVEAVSMADPNGSLDASKSVGEYARSTPASVVRPDVDDDQPIELDNSGNPVDTPGAAAPIMGHNSSKAAKKGGNKFKIPNFDKFRMWIVIGVAGVLLLIFVLYLAFSVMPRAHITIKTDSTALEDTFDITLNTNASSVNTDTNTIPSVTQSSDKTLSQQSPATGQKDNGTKASGVVSMNAGQCTGSAPNNVPSGTTLSASGLTFVTQSDISFVPQFSGGKCSWGSANKAGILAQSNGANYNLSYVKFTVNGRSDITVSTDGTTGGTSQIVKVIAQSDVDDAKSKITSQDATSVKQQLKSSLQAQGLFPIDDSLTTSTPQVSTSANVGDQADSVTVTAKVTYAMSGAKQDYIKKLIDAAVKDKIDASKQKIIDYGLSDAVFKLQNQNGSRTLLSMNVTAIAGSDLDLADIRKQVAGKKSGDAKEIIGKYPSITDVDISYSPFWVSSIPKNAGKINITVEKPAVKK
jgi:hypothetical protein